jgi:asparagine synthase (glutamine-hydrolysing)
MSAIAGIIHFNGAPLEPGLVEKMTAAMARRGPDGIRQWVQGSVGLGQCLLRTTPESLEEALPLTNEDESLVLVMDGRVDNWEDLRRQLARRGAVLRDHSDAELVLRAYEAWGEDCADQIIGELVFFVWDARQQRLFGARDAAGRRHFYYHIGNGWFAFASEIKGLLALQRIEPRLNESRLLDYLWPEFSRDDPVGTFYQDIDRLPAGHAMRIWAQDVKTWRYWNPGDLPPTTFASLDECAEAFLAQLRGAVKCRLRGIGPLGAGLSGGLDSSSIVGLISREFRGELSQPLRTFSLIRADRENCPDWRSIQQMLKNDDWIEASVIHSDISIDTCRDFLNLIQEADEPFVLTEGLAAFILIEAARSSGCKVFFEGAAGDLLFYGYNRSANVILERKLYSWLPALFAANDRHGIGIASGIGKLTRSWLFSLAPASAQAAVGGLRDKRAAFGDEKARFLTDSARQLIAAKYTQRRHAQDHLRHSNEQIKHAQFFTSGLLSFAYEVGGELALSKGVEMRSPFSDRRMIEFAIQMPVEAKLCAGWYKHVLRRAMKGILPEEVRWRREILGHPGWKFYECLFDKMIAIPPDISGHSEKFDKLDKWVKRGAAERSAAGCHESQFELYSLASLSRWLSQRF